MARHLSDSNGWLWALPSLAIPLLIAGSAWAIHVSSEGDVVAPNVRFADVDVSGMTPEELAVEVDRRMAELSSRQVVIDLGDRRVEMPAEEIGFRYLRGETLADVLSARHVGNVWDELGAWIRTPLDEVTILDRITLDEEVARARLGMSDFVVTDPIEPQLSNEGASFMYVVPGVDGVGADADTTISTLRGADLAAGMVEVRAEMAPVAPRMSDETAEDLALQVNDMTRHGIAVAVEGRSAKLTPGQIRSHVSAVIDGDGVSVAIDAAGVQREIEAAFPDPIGDFTAPVIQVADGELEVVSPGSAPPVCCSIGSVEAAVETLLDGGAPIYSLETRPNDDPELLAWADGTLIVEPVSEFTTRHSCCENRVVNIHTIADALRGVYLVPGETLSLNEFVGPRTREKGYLPAGAIRGGHMTDEVGGGVSQFVTTIFNAAFFAGLELDEYQSHSVYFSRYPFGREATLSIPGPDLVFTNTTDYPVLIWPTYDATSITVTMYSTKHIEVEEIAHRISKRRQCTHSQIDRQRTYPDGRVVVDTIVANYRPGDGIDCDGNPIPQS